MATSARPGRRCSAAVAPPPCGDLGGERLQEVLDGVGAHDLLANWCRNGPGPGTTGRILISTVSGRIPCHVRVDSGSVRDGGRNARPKYSISTDVPGVALAAAIA
jgi:hypothetical protein